MVYFVVPTNQRGSLDVPIELAALPQWVGWKYETRKGKTTKPPYRASDGKRASSTNPEDWCTLEDALHGAEVNGLSGVGFVFSENDPYCGVDLDDCRDPKTGIIHDEAQVLIDYMASYTEVSPSGTGVHAIVKAAMAGPGRRTKDTPWGGHLECYDKGRYFTWTGKALNGPEIRFCPLKIDLLDDDAPAKGDNGSWIVEARKSELFRELYEDGDLSEYSGDHSAADLALMNLLVNHIGENRPRVVMHAFMRSALYRGDAKSGGDDYVLRTLERALTEASPDDQHSRAEVLFEREVSKQVKRLKVSKEAKRRLITEEMPDDIGLLSMSLQEQLALPPVLDNQRIDGLQQVGFNVLLVASYKSGKTTLTLNLLKALADHGKFLGRFQVHPFEGNIAVFNYEEQQSYWLENVRRQGIKNTHRIFPVHRRGEPILPLWEEEHQEKLVDWMIDHDIQYWIMDPTVVAWQGLVDNENDNTLVAAFTTALDQVKHRAGIGELLLTHHTGRSGETRGRGATRLDDWKDVGWLLEKDEATNVRSVWTEGRGGEVERFHLAFDQDKWQLVATEPESEEKKKEHVRDLKDAKRACVEILDEMGELSQSALVKELKERGHSWNQNQMTSDLKRWATSPDNPIQMSKKKIGNMTKITYSLERTAPRAPLSVVE